jgi:polysaccharide export outer membrane protein
MFLPGSLAVLLAGCAGVIPSTGPSASSVRNVRTKETGIQIVNLTSSVASRLEAMRAPQSFPEDFRRDLGPKTTVEPGDVLEVAIMEAPPASLFGNVPNGTGSGSMGAQSVTFPEQSIGSSGNIYLPFAGAVHAAGRTVEQIEDDITNRLKAKANQPQVLVRIVTNNTNYVTVVGAVTADSHISLTPARERLLDALTKAGGGANEVRDYTIRVTRGGRSITVPLESIVRDPSQNIVLRGGDVITVMRQPYRFMIMGASSRTQEAAFEGPYITLAQALARSEGLSDAQANIRGVFVFRFESPDALDWPVEPVMLTRGGKVRVLYCLDLSKPEGFFAAKTFPVRDGDLIYCAHAPALGLEKVLGLVGSIAAPALTSAYEATATVNGGTP